MCIPLHSAIALHSDFSLYSFYLSVLKHLHAIHPTLIHRSIDGAGDEILEWNGRGLHNKSADEVYDIIDESRLDAQVELIVSRPIGSGCGSGGSSANVSPISGASGGSANSVPARRSSANFPHSGLASSMAGSAVVSSGGRYLQRKGTIPYPYSMYGSQRRRFL